VIGSPPYLTSAIFPLLTTPLLPDAANQPNGKGVSHKSVFKNEKNPALSLIYYANER